MTDTLGAATSGYWGGASVMTEITVEIEEEEEITVEIEEDPITVEIEEEEELIVELEDEDE